MPCYVTGSEIGDIQLSAQEAHDAATAATRAACELAKAVPSSKLKKMSAATQKWVKQHVKSDRKKP
jgi:hypothetical protein